MLIAEMLMFGLFVPLPAFTASAAGLAALPAISGQGPLVAAFAELAALAESSDRFLDCRILEIQGLGLSKQELDEVIRLLQAQKEQLKPILPFPHGHTPAGQSKR
jgi:hypothetical protein